MKLFSSEYRIIRDSWAGFEVQKRRWFWPFWTQIGVDHDLCNTSSSIEQALNLIARDILIKRILVDSAVVERMLEKLKIND